MPIEGQYETYYGVHLKHVSESWGGDSYNKLLTKEYYNSDVSSSVSTQSTEAKFLYPRLVGNPCMVDGVADGYITLGNTNATGAVIDSYTVTLLKTDNVPNNETTLGSYAYTTGSSGTEKILQNQTKKFPFFISISKKVITYNERIILKIEYTSTDGTVYILHDNDSTYEDVKIRIPYVSG